LIVETKWDKQPKLRKIVDIDSPMLRIDRLSGVVTFVEAARAGSFTAASERLGISKSAVGKSIARLEERLGTKLFHRTTRRSRLTLEGESYLASCASALDEIAAAETALDAGRFTPRGRLRIDMPGAFGRRVLVPILAEIARAEPGLQFAMSFTDRFVDLVEEGIGLAIRIGDLEDSSGLVVRKLVEQTRVICASRQYLDTRGTPMSIEDLRTHDGIVALRRETSIAWLIADRDGTLVHLAPRQTHEIGDAEAMLTATLAGCGLVQLPMWMVREHLKSGALVAVLTEFATPKVNVHAVWPRTRHLAPKVRHVVDALVVRAVDERLS